MDSSEELEKTMIVPYCRKILEGCPPCKVERQTTTPSAKVDDFQCVKELARYLQIDNNVNKEAKEKSYDRLFECLKQYGDIYKQLGIVLYKNPKTKLAMFPTNERIQANLNEYLRNINPNTTSEKEMANIEYNLVLYNILLTDKLKQMYDEFYYSIADVDWLEENKYGIDKLLGGKRKTRRQTKKKRKTNRKTRT